MKVLEAVIFDGDGVLIRSMERNAEAYRETLRRVGLEIGDDEVYENEGRGSRELIALLARDHGLDLSAEQLEDLTGEHQRIFASFGVMPLYSDAETVLRSIRLRPVRTALVTANGRENALRNLGSLVSLLDTIVTVEDVTRTKPDPEPYIAALSKLRVPAARAVVVENSPLGIQAAKSAGLEVVAITTTNTAARLAQADSIIGRLAELTTALASLGWKSAS
jgi:beta-phosphoglucomutase